MTDDDENELIDCELCHGEPLPNSFLETVERAASVFLMCASMRLSKDLMSDMHYRCNIFPVPSRNIFHETGGVFPCHYSDMDIRTRIDELLAEKRWGRKTLSRAMGGVSEDFVRKFMENPAQQMGHENLIKAADALGVTTEYLLHGNPITEEAEAQRVVSIFRDIAQSDRSIALEVLKKFAEPKADG